jgi:hypothetical protein
MAAARQSRGPEIRIGRNWRTGQASKTATASRMAPTVDRSAGCRRSFRFQLTGEATDDILVNLDQGSLIMSAAPSVLRPPPAPSPRSRPTGSAICGACSGTSEPETFPARGTAASSITGAQATNSLPPSPGTEQDCGGSLHHLAAVVVGLLGMRTSRKGPGKIRAASP